MSEEEPETFNNITPNGDPQDNKGVYFLFLFSFLFFLFSSYSLILLFFNLSLISSFNFLFLIFFSFFLHFSRMEQNFWDIKKEEDQVGSKCFLGITLVSQPIKMLLKCC